MVSNKTIIILITIAIILSVLSVVVTISTVNTKMIPDISSYKPQSVHDKESANIGITVNAPSKTP